MSVKLEKDAKVQIGDVVRIRQTVTENGKLAGFHGIVTDMFECADASQGAVVFVNVWNYVKVNDRIVADPSDVIARGEVFSREQIRPVYRP